MANPDITNKTLFREILIPFGVLAIGGLIGYGTLWADVAHKADKTDIAIIATEMKNIAEDVSENKENIESVDAKVDTNHDLLIKISTKLGIETTD